MIYNSLYAGEQERLESEAEISRINPIGGRFRQSNSFSDYTRDDHSFYIGEIFSGTFVKFNKCGHYNKVYALFDLDDGRSTRVHRVSFEVHGYSIDDYQLGTCLVVKKVGFMPDRNITKWVVKNPPYQI